MKYKTESKKEETEHQRNERIMAFWTRRVGIFTFVLALVAIVSAVIVYHQMIVMRRQLDAMEADQRPWVGIYNVETNPISVGEALLIRPILINSGRSPAFDWTAAFDRPIIQETDAGVSDRADCDSGACSRGMLVPNAKFPIDVSLPKEEMTAAFVKLILSGKKTIYIRGKTTYSDSAKRFHKTTICMFYNANASAFGYCARQNSNYAD